MTNFPVDVLGAIKSMLIRSIGNPNAFKYTLNNLLYSYKDIILMIITIVIMIFLVKFTYKLIKKILENKKKKEKLLTKKDLKENFSKEKTIFKILKYPIIGSILVGTSWIRVSILFWLFDGFYETQGDIIKETLPIQESRVLGMWATYSLGIFIIAGCFIGLSFGNKMIRNLGILIYVLGIFFIFFGNFLNNGVIINDLPNFVM